MRRSSVAHLEERAALLDQYDLDAKERAAIEHGDTGKLHECKVSNSATDRVERLKNDAAVKAKDLSVN